MLAKFWRKITAKIKICWVVILPRTVAMTIATIARLTKSKQSQAHRDVIENTFEIIHNGPLQTLAQALKLIREQDMPPEKLVLTLEKYLEKLDRELRGIYDCLQQEALNQDSSLYLESGIVINLQDPIHEVLYQVYSYTLERDFPYFQKLRVKIRTFEPIEDAYLSLSQKRGLCRFLEEALCNVGKHAVGATRLEVSCTKNEGWYTLSIIDNGLGINSSREGRGTQQSRNLARQLKGKFRRSNLFPRGTLCELSWTALVYGRCEQQQI
ncbi:putative sensor with CHASE2 domain protein [Calothrix sp. NIES-4101]|nr:putative sensor with CHASE2 domain protein [Calothrix sp. NIES-4101]